MRDPNKLQVFHLAHRFAQDIYRVTMALPESERYHLQTQLRRAAVSISTNIVEGCARAGRGEYEHFLNIALGSAVEASYLLDLVVDLELLAGAAVEECRTSSKHLLRALHNLHAAVRQLDAPRDTALSGDRPLPEARSLEPGAWSLEPSARRPDAADSRSPYPAARPRSRGSL